MDDDEGLRRWLKDPTMELPEELTRSREYEPNPIEEELKLEERTDD